MAARSGQLGQVPRPSRLRRLGSAAKAGYGAVRGGVRATVDLPLSTLGSDRGVAARVRRRVRALGLARAGITVESWRGEVTLRGTLGVEEAQRLATELAQVRGVHHVNNFLRP